jgi:hypothetical protein
MATHIEIDFERENIRESPVFVKSTVVRDGCEVHEAFEVTDTAEKADLLIALAVAIPSTTRVNRLVECPGETQEDRDAALVQRLSDAAVAEGRY